MIKKLLIFVDKSGQTVIIHFLIK